MTATLVLLTEYLKSKLKNQVSWHPVLFLWTLFSLIIWQAPRAGKVNQITWCDWLPEQARWSHLACSWLPALYCEKNLPESHIINPLLTKFVRSRWLDIFVSLWTSTSSRSINTKKERGQYPAILTSHYLVNNPCIIYLTILLLFHEHALDMRW